jgi:hypothetical protein
MIRRGAVAAFAVALIAVVLSACALYKPGSFGGSQPQGIGPVHLGFTLCTENGAEEICTPAAEANETQEIVAFAVPKSSDPPQSFSAAPTSAGPTLAFTRNQEVSQQAAELTPEEGKPAWPPAGDEVVGYLSNVYTTNNGDNLEWKLDAGFGLPSGSDGGSFNSILTAGLVTGFRAIEESLPSSRPVECQESQTTCAISAEATVPVSDLKISPEPSTTTSGLVGGEARVPFKLDFASTVSGALPSFNLSATTTLPGGTASPTEASFAPASVDAGTHRASASRIVSIKVPASAGPGTYQVNLVATTPSGGSATGTGTIVVSKPTIKLGKLKLNKAKGTASLAVTASATGKATLSGKGLAKAAKAIAVAGKPAQVKVRATGKGLKTLRSTGKLKAKAKISLQPGSGAAVAKSRPLTLKLKAQG